MPPKKRGKKSDEPKYIATRVGGHDVGIVAAGDHLRVVVGDEPVFDSRVKKLKLSKDTLRGLSGAHPSTERPPLTGQARSCKVHGCWTSANSCTLAPCC